MLTDDGQGHAPVGTSGSGRAFGHLWAAFGLSSTADGIYRVALPVATLALGGGPVAVAGVMAASRAPWVLLSLHAGVLADRVDRRQLLRAVSTGRVVLLLAAAVLVSADLASVAVLIVVAFAMGAGETVFDTALHSSTPGVVEPRSLERANSRLQTTEMVANEFIGPPVGGLLAGIALGYAFGATALLYVAALVALGGLRLRPAPTPQVSSDTRIRSGLRALAADRTLLTYAAGAGTMNCAFAAFYVALPLVALEDGPLGLRPEEYGLLFAFTGVGGVLAGLTAPALLRRIGPRRALAVGSSVLAVGLAAPGLALSTPVLCVGLLASGMVVLTSVTTVSYRQRVVPDHLLGRVTAAYRLLAFGGLPLGSVLAGVVAALGSPRAVFLLAGVLALLAGAAMTLRTERTTVPPTVVAPHDVVDST